METTQSLDIIERMLQESKRSLHRNSFYFILWGLLMVPIGLAEPFIIQYEYFWVVWPIAGIMGGIASIVYGMREGKRSGVSTAGDRITSYTWGAFVISMVIAIVFSLYNRIAPHAMILLLAGMATFISGGICKFKPFVFGGVIMWIGAITCTFLVEMPYQGFVSAASLFMGYVIPGFILRKSENVQAQ